MTSPEFRYAYPHPAVTTDVVLFGLHGNLPVVLLIRRRSDPYARRWALPGGFLEIDEELENCARRELAEETGLRGLHLEQFHTFGRPGRDPRERVISIAYLGLAPADAPAPQAASDAVKVAWFPAAELPPLAFDHERIIALARRRVLAEWGRGNTGFLCANRLFAPRDLQRLEAGLAGSDGGNPTRLPQSSAALSRPPL